MGLPKLDQDVIDKLNRYYLFIQRAWTRPLKYKVNRVYRDGLNECITSPFISDRIKQEIKKVKRGYKVKYGKLELNWYGGKKEIDGLMRRAVISTMLINPDHPGIYMTVIPTKFKKRLGKERKVDIDTINSGSSMMMRGVKSHMFVWRREELKKVFVHELVHSLWGDQALHNGMSETYTEMNANILNVMFKNAEVSGRGWRSLLEKERTHSLKQCSKVYDLLNVDHFEQVAGRKDNIVQYFVYRAGLMYELNRYIKTIPLFKFPNDRVLIKKYMNLIENGCKKMGVKRGVAVVGDSMRMSYTG